MIKNIIKKFSLALLIIVVLFVGLVFIKPDFTKAFIVTDISNLLVNIKDSAWKVGEKAVNNIATVLFKNTTKYFVNQLAYNAATAIVEGGTGKTPLFPKLPIGSMLEQAAGDALGEFIDTVAKDGLGDFDICNPASIKTTLDITLPAFKEADPGSFDAKGAGYKAKCSWQEIQKRWTDFKEAAYADPQKYLAGVKLQFKDGANDLDISAKVRSKILSEQNEKELNAKIDVLANLYMKPVVSPISKLIKTPASVVKDSFSNDINKSSIPDTTFTGNLLADALGIFTNTLAAKLQKKIMDGLNDNSLPQSRITLNQLNILNTDSKYEGSDQFADFKKVNVARVDGGSMDVFEKFASERLTMQGDNVLAKGPGYTSEVLPNSFLIAARQELTVKQAIDKGIIEPTIQFGFSKQKIMNGPVPEDYVDVDIKADDGVWSNEQLSYRSILISRIHRVVPQSWELASLFWRYYDKTNTKALTLQRMLDCFADTRTTLSPYGTPYNEDPRYPGNCRVDMNNNGSVNDLNPMIDYNPYFHLVDPNWVLKLPSNKCLIKGAGPEIIFQNIMCSEDNIDAGENAKPSGGDSGSTAISRGEGVPICDAGQAKNLGIDTVASGIKYDIPTKTIAREDNYCADWQTCINETDDGRCQAYGYCVEEKSVTKLNADSCAFPMGTDNGLYSSCDKFQIAGQSYNLLKNTLQQCAQTDAGCKQYATQMSKDANQEYVWNLSNTSSSVYLNGQAQPCDKRNDGCTKVAEYKTGINLLYNGNFSSAEFGSQGIYPSGWVLSGNDRSLCNFEGKYKNESGATLYSEGVDCYVKNEAPVLVNPEYTYSFDYEFITESEANITVLVKGINSAGEVLKTETIAPTSSSEWLAVSRKITLGPNNQAWEFPLETTGLNIEFVRDEVAGKVGLRNAKLTIINGPLVNIAEVGEQQSTSVIDYQRSSLPAYKLPPDYLKCNLYYEKLGNFNKDDCATRGGVWNETMEMCAVGGDKNCENYSPLCKAQDVGCQLFKSEDGSLEVPAKVSGDDICPAQCVGYDSYSRQPSFFEASEYPSLYSTASACQNAGGYWNVSNNACQAQPSFANLIPATAKQCSAEAVGCQSFTNIADVATGGERQAYFSYLRPCVNESATTTTKIFYTWEGSDTSGYQLKKWSRLMSNNGFGPCTNVDADTGACLDTGDSNVWSTGPNSGNKAVCSEGDLAKNADCRDFFDINDKHYYVLQSKTIITKDPKTGDACVPFRNDASGKVYNADLTDAVRCSAQNVGCRMFKGGTSNNVTTLINDDFEFGTIGAWSSMSGAGNNLTISNESLRQGGRSLAVATHDRKISYKNSTDIIKDNKEYTLVFLAKKITTNIGNPEASLDPEEPPLNFVLEGNLQTEWREYKIGPIVANNVSANTITLAINNLTGDEGYLIDEIRLLEGRDIYYLIDKSWTIPVACDNPINNLEGCDANGENCGERTAVGAQMGCNYYVDKSQQRVSIKSFTQLCSSLAVDCQAFVNTYNSESPAGLAKNNICDSTSGVIKNGSCIVNGVAVCQTTGDSCEYSSAVVPADKLIYFAPLSQHACDPAFAGCMALGVPKYDLTQVPAPIKEFDTTYLLNNPDKYSDILCSASGLLCELMVGSNGGQGVFVSPIGSDDSNGRLCIFDKTKNRWVQKLNPDKNCEFDNPVPANERTAYLTPSENPNYRGWVGMCEEQFVGCKELRNPEQAVTASANWCDASINASDYGECDTTKEDILITNSFGKFCQKKFSGINHSVCKLNGSATKCNYTANSDWYCFGKENLVNGRDQDASCQINGNDICVIQSNGNGVQNDGYCTYSALCKSSYALEKSIKKCANGIVDRGAGCAPFYDVTQATVSGSAQATKDKGTLVACDENAKPGDEKYCNTNVILENRLTRQCSEWLYCTSGAQVDGKSICYDVGRCSEADPANPNNCKKPSVKSNVTVKNQTFDFANTFERENVRNLTGFSKAGIRWSSDKVIEGYSAPESMKQSVSYAKLTNGDFEKISADVSDVAGWKLSGDGCELPSDNLFDGVDSWDGFYSMKLTLRNKGYCQIESNSGKDFDENKNYYLSLSPSNRYVISFAGRSSTGKQIATVGMKYYDANFNECAINEDKYNSLPNIFVKGIYEYLVTLNNSKYYYNKFCIDKSGNQTLPSGQIPNWIQGQTSKNIAIGKDWQKYNVVVEPNNSQFSMPRNASYGRIIIKAPQRLDDSSLVVGDVGSIWLDNVNLDSSLQVSTSRFASTMCRLYPSADAKQCSYTKFDKTYQGLEGYCLEEDPYVPGQCLQWFPVDTAGGNSIYTPGEEIQAYDNRPSLYMCVASKGNNDLYNYYSTNAGNHFLNTCSETTSEQSLSMNSYNLKDENLKNIKLEDIEEIKVKFKNPNDCENIGEDWNVIFTAPRNLIKSNDLENGKKIWWYGAVSFKENQQNIIKDVNSPGFYQAYKDIKAVANGQSETCTINGVTHNECNVLALGFEFDGSLNTLSKMILSTRDGSSEKGGARLESVTVKLKESCELIAQVVNENGENKVNQVNYNSSLGIYGTSTDKIPFLKNMPTSPFASINFDSTINATPNQWPDAYVPFNFANNVSSMPLSTLKSVNNPNNYNGICQKVKNPETNSDYEGGWCVGEKVRTATKETANVCELCVGVGKRIYSKVGDNLVITPTRCDSTDNAQNCLPVDGLYHPVVNPDTDGVYKTGVNRLKKLFAKVFKWYKLTVNNQGKPVYVETSADAETGLYKDISNQGLPGKVGPVVIGSNNIDRNVIIDAPGGSQVVTFKVDIPDAQLPIKKLFIDWGDGSNPTEFYGEFNERNRPDNPFTFTHWYGCVPTADGNRCRLCNNGSVSENGSCEYNGPKILVQDNWDWCAVGHNQTSSSSLYQTKYGSFCSSQAQSDDFIQYGGKIIIRPR